MTSDAPDVLNRVHEALHGLAAALESGDPEAVLDAEVPLATAAAALSRLTPVSIPHTPAIARTLLNTRLAVDRCLTLGQASADLLAIVASGPGYDVAGRHPRPVRTSTLGTRS